MLILSRKQKETILIDHPAGPVTVVVHKLVGDKVKLGFIAPREVSVVRGELVEGGAR